MLKQFILALTVLCSLQGFSQKNGDYTAVAKSITDEAYKLFYLERASWVGTDIMLATFDKDELGNFSGYFSYKADDDHYTCLFFSRDKEPVALFTATFDTSFSEKTVKVSTAERELTPQEKDILAVRNKTLELIKKDDLFVAYKNTNFNVVPMIDGSTKKAYVLTGTTESGILILGNDYYIEFTDKLDVKEKKKIHQNIITIPLEKQEGIDPVGSVHNHKKETGDYITATDVCTLMLYSGFVPSYETHIVMSDKAVSIWNYKTKSLTIISKKVFDKISKDQSKRHK